MHDDVVLPLNNHAKGRGQRESRGILFGIEERLGEFLVLVRVVEIIK